MHYCETPAESAVGYLWSIFLVKTRLRRPLKHTTHVVRILFRRALGVL